MRERSVVHATFVIERRYDASVARVFAAWASPAAKSAWFGLPDEHSDGPHELDFQVGGRERFAGRPPGAAAHYTFAGTYHDIVPDERIVSSYDMHADDDRISVSLVTIEFRPDGAGTHLVYTEQAVFLDGHDTPKSRIGGTEQVLDKLGEALRRGAQH
jgi:uncharacterized protein YndB with AHSA1/START domain